MEKLKNLLLLSAIILSGCSLYQTEKVVDNTDEVVVVVNKDLASKIKLSLKEAPKEDCIKVYKFFSGLSLYVQHVQDDNLMTDEILNKTLLKAQTDYGWNRDTYPKLSEAISEDLIAKKLDDPHKLGDIIEQEKIRDILVKALDEYSLAVKTVVESK